MFSKRRVAALVAEFLGTGVLAFVVLTVHGSQIGIPYFISIAAAMAVLILGLALQRDVQLNPAYTLGLWTARRINTLKAVLFIAVQLLGGLAAFELFKFFSRGAVQPMPTTYESRILVAEALGAFVFAFAASGALYQRLHYLVRPVVTAGGYALGVIIAASAAAGFINPAVALASNAWGWSTYVLGPVIGAVIGVNLYGLLFAPREGAVAKVNAAKAVRKSEVDSADDEEDTKPVAAVVRSNKDVKTEVKETAKSDNKLSKKSGKKKSKK
jgi:aquaporin Z